MNNEYSDFGSSLIHIISVLIVIDNNGSVLLVLLEDSIDVDIGSHSILF